jgi:hypothetical protein
MSGKTVPGARGHHLPPSGAAGLSDVRLSHHVKRPAVVLRSSWPAVASISAPILVVFLVLQSERSVGGVVVVFISVAAVAATAHQLQYVALTPQGLEIHQFALRHVPWQVVGSVELVHRVGGVNLRLYTFAKRRGRYLPAPRGAFGVGRKEAAETCTAIETWWLANRGSTPPVGSRPHRLVMIRR